METSRGIRLRGVRVHNLKGIDLDLPRDALIVFTGVSGSGKSSLAFDTLYAEGQRRYIETFSAYTRQFLETLDKPDADAIEGIPPAIAVAQHRGGMRRSGRSTVGTVTEIHDHLALLFAKLGTVICPACDQPLAPASPSSVANALDKLPARTRYLVAFPLDVRPDSDRAALADSLRADGFTRVRVGGQLVPLEGGPVPVPADGDGGTIDVVVDRLVRGSEASGRRLDSIETAFARGLGRCRVVLDDRVLTFYRGWRCPSCGRGFREPEPRLFRYNNPLGACPTCEGFGRIIDVDLARAVPDATKSIADGAIAPWTIPAHRPMNEALIQAAPAQGVPVDVPFARLTPEQVARVVAGAPGQGFAGLRGFFRRLEATSYKVRVRNFLSRWRGDSLCPDCHGTRLRPEALAVKLGGLDIAEFAAKTVRDARAFLDGLDVSRVPRSSNIFVPPFKGGIKGGVRSTGGLHPSNPPFERGGNTTPDIDSMSPGYHVDLSLQGNPVALRIIGQIRMRLDYLDRIGLGYLTLDRRARTLSGGEAQRVALTSALGAGLVRTLYVLDEPSVGLHPHDVGRLVSVVNDLRDVGNTVVVVEHDDAIVRAADHVVDIGPGAGEAGGRVVYAGPPATLADATGSVTADFFSGRRLIPVPERRRAPGAGWLKLTGARGNNLKGIDVAFPLGLFCVVTGVSGAGKSTLIEETLYPALRHHLGRDAPHAEPFDALTGTEGLDDVVLVDPSPIGRSGRSNPVTFLKAFDEIRKTFAATHEAKLRNYGAGRFSFNVPGGRCNACEGNGFLTVNMQFLPDVLVRCPECRGTRYRAETLEVTYRGKNIAEVLDLTAREAFGFFQRRPLVQARLRPLLDVGLEYLRLGQPASTLSGGEAQRLKLASRLASSPAAITRAAGKSGSRTLFLLDEPTTGLHPADTVKLLDALGSLLVVGHSLIVVEHSSAVMAAADWIIDLGPGAGDEGGRVVAAGTPEDVAKVHSPTGRVLSARLGGASKAISAGEPAH